jgi:hypothetical protein
MLDGVDPRLAWEKRHRYRNFMGKPLEKYTFGR